MEDRSIVSPVVGAPADHAPPKLDIGRAYSAQDAAARPGHSRVGPERAGSPGSDYAHLPHRRPAILRLCLGENSWAGPSATTPGTTCLSRIWSRTSPWPDTAFGVRARGILPPLLISRGRISALSALRRSFSKATSSAAVVPPARGSVPR